MEPYGTKQKKRTKMEVNGTKRNQMEPKRSKWKQMEAKLTIRILKEADSWTFLNNVYQEQQQQQTYSLDPDYYILAVKK